MLVAKLFLLLGNKSRVIQYIVCRFVDKTHEFFDVETVVCKLLVCPECWVVALQARFI